MLNAELKMMKSLLMYESFVSRWERADRKVDGSEDGVLG